MSIPIAQILLLDGAPPLQPALAQLLAPLAVRSVNVGPTDTVERVLHELKTHLTPERQPTQVLLVSASIRLAGPLGITGLSRLEGLAIAEGVQERWAGSLPVLVVSPMTTEQMRSLAERSVACPSIDLITETRTLVTVIAGLLPQQTAVADTGVPGEQPNDIRSRLRTAFDNFFAVLVPALERAVEGSASADVVLEWFGKDEWNDLLTVCGDAAASHGRDAAGAQLKDILFSIRGLGALQRIARLPAGPRKQRLLEGYLAELRSIRASTRWLHQGDG